MPKRICDACGKEKDVEGGKTCSNGHFICYDCVHSTEGLFFGSPMDTCPICKQPLR